MHAWGKYIFINNIMQIPYVLLWSQYNIYYNIGDYYLMQQTISSQIKANMSQKFLTHDMNAAIFIYLLMQIDAETNTSWSSRNISTWKNTLNKATHASN